MQVMNALPDDLGRQLEVACSIITQAYSRQVCQPNRMLRKPLHHSWVSDAASDAAIIHTWPQVTHMESEAIQLRESVSSKASRIRELERKVQSLEQEVRS
jgi:hypothetical protein